MIENNKFQFLTSLRYHITNVNESDFVYDYGVPVFLLAAQLGKWRNKQNEIKDLLKSLIFESHLYNSNMFLIKMSFELFLDEQEFADIFSQLDSLREIIESDEYREMVQCAIDFLKKHIYGRVTVLRNVLLIFG
ncbi:hypothetical protein MHBO_000890 [Bonamia ostreae]|uniref:Uncharacterized protein n=1 Tax=Bonamia ostreae TaxID=126728 RepID=A0ABV2AID7_9EUKA